jgi:hypothetical protein
MFSFDLALPETHFFGQYYQDKKADILKAKLIMISEKFFKVVIEYLNTFTFSPWALCVTRDFHMTLVRHEHFYPGIMEQVQSWNKFKF